MVTDIMGLEKRQVFLQHPVENKASYCINLLWYLKK
jgi:hypothetical protein